MQTSHNTFSKVPDVCVSQQEKLNSPQNPVVQGLLVVHALQRDLDSPRKHINIEIKLNIAHTYYTYFTGKKKNCNGEYHINRTPLRLM